jgi:hypothetical protein
LGRVKGMGGSVAGCMRWAREGKIDSRYRTWMAPESARMGEGVIEHRRAGGEESSSSESYGDSRATKGLREAKREYVGLKENVVWGNGKVVWRRENASRSTWDGGGEGLSSVPGGEAWGVANRVEK